MSLQLNLPQIKDRLLKLGYGQTRLAKEIGVTRSAISLWLTNQKFPRPRHVLKLSRVLKLGYEDIVKEELNSQPVVAFRKKGNTKTVDKHYQKALAMGKLLGDLASFLPFAALSNPPILKEPQIDYFYIQNVASEVRKILNLTTEVIDFEDLIGCFLDLQAVIIPVLWGAKKGPHNHENALHIHLPKSQTTWVYLNLDTKVHDFKFWMAHELGHTKAPHLIGDDGELFADKFAGALLFPEELAKKEYQELKEIQSNGSKVSKILDTAEKFTISPYTVLGEVNSFAMVNDLKPLNLNIGGATTNFNKHFKLLSECFFESKKPHPAKYIKSAQAFNSPFFEALSKYLKENDKSSSFISEVLNISLIDAKAIFIELR